MMQPDPNDRGRVDGTPRRVLIVGSWLVLIAVGLVSCTPQRPSREEWRESWNRVQAVVPPAHELPRPPGHDTCSEVLGELRERAGELTPAPDEIIHDAAQAWVAHAESLFFDCFDNGESEQGIEEGYATLARLRAEVEAVLVDRDE